jgi:hypothetical protein
MEKNDYEGLIKIITVPPAKAKARERTTISKLQPNLTGEGRKKFAFTEAGPRNGR